LNAFVRQLAALAALWALCELLLPQRQQQMVRLAVSLMVMAALVVSLGRFLGSVPQTEWPVFSPVQPVETITGYQRIALTSLANQVEQLCLRTAHRAGYEARAAVYLRQDGSLERIDLYLCRGEEPPLMEESALAASIAQWLSVPPEQIRWRSTDGEATP